MTNKKKTLYEVLEISPSASSSEIHAARLRLAQKLQSERTSSNSGDIDFKLSVMNAAFHTLSVPRSRAAYDAQLAGLDASANVAAPSSAFPVPYHAEAVSLKVDALSLKADAVSLKADAVGLKADAMSLKIASVMESHPESPLKKMARNFTSLAAPFKRALTVVGGLMVVGMGIQVTFAMLANRHMKLAAEEASKAKEKMVIQEYYQKYGVRPASKEEAVLLEAENRRIEIENLRMENEQREVALAKQRKDEEERRFVEESMRIGERVSADLRRAEQEARYEEEQQRQQLERERLEREEAAREAERERIEEDRRQTEEARRKLGLS